MLNVARAGAALALLLYHLRYLTLCDYASLVAPSSALKLLYFLTGLGHQAIAVYFVASGAELGLRVLGRRRAPPRRWLLARLTGTLRRISGLLVLGLILDELGLRYFDGRGVYTRYPDFCVVSDGVSVFLRNLVLLQPWSAPTFGSNGLLWIVACEWWYGCAALILAWMWRRYPGVAAALFAALLGADLLTPTELGNWALVWSLGVVAALFLPKVSNRPLRALGLAMLVAGLCGARILEAQAAQFVGSPALWFSLAKDLLVGLSLALCLLTCAPPSTAQDSGTTAPRPRPLVRMGELGKTALLVHFPIMMLLVGFGASHLSLELKHVPDIDALAYFVWLALAICFICSLTHFAARALLRGMSGWMLGPVDI